MVPVSSSPSLKSMLKYCLHGVFLFVLLYDDTIVNMLVRLLVFEEEVVSNVKGP